MKVFRYLLIFLLMTVKAILLCQFHLKVLYSFLKELIEFLIAFLSELLLHFPGLTTLLKFFTPILYLFINNI